MSNLVVRLRNCRKSGKPLDTCLEAANYIEQLESVLQRIADDDGNENCYSEFAKSALRPINVESQSDRGAE